MIHTKSMRLATAVVAGGLTLLLGAAGADAQDPPGNNGTIKIDGVEFDQHPDNQPHVGCTFEVDFYGFDEGDLEAQVAFYAIPPTTTQPGSQDELLLSDTVDIGEDPAGGGTDLDAEREYDLTAALAGITPHPQQGWHIRLEINAEGSIGDDSKSKVFWVTGCVPPTSSTTSSTTPEDTTTTTKPGETTTTTKPGETTTTLAGGVTTTVGGGAAPQGSTTTAPGGGELPRTGNDARPLAALAVLLLGGGLGIGLVARRLAASRAA